jgi:Transglutaminase-like superfamily
MQRSTLRTRLRQWRRLSGAERRLLAEAWLLLGLTKTGLVVSRFGVVRGSLDRYAHRSTRPNASPEQAAWAVAAAARRLPGGATCLPRALVCDAMLRRRGYPARLHIGVAGRGGVARLRAHAWVEMDDRVVIGDLDDLAGFAPLRPTP